MRPRILCDTETRDYAHRKAALRVRLQCRGLMLRHAREMPALYGWKPFIVLGRGVKRFFNTLEEIEAAFP